MALRVDLVPGKTAEERGEAVVVARLVEESFDAEGFGLAPIFRQAEIRKDDHLRSPGTALERTQDAEAGAGAQVQIENQYIRGRAAHGAQRLSLAVDRVDQVDIGQPPEQLRKPRGEQRGILDKQYAQGLTFRLRQDAATLFHAAGSRAPPDPPATDGKSIAPSSARECRSPPSGHVSAH